MWDQMQRVKLVNARRLKIFKSQDTLRICQELKEGFRAIITQKLLSYKVQKTAVAVHLGILLTLQSQQLKLT